MTFENTIEKYGDEATMDMIIQRTIDEYCDDSAMKIGQYAFCECAGLIKVDVPKVTSIANYAFQNCRALIKVNLPEVTEIGVNGFYSTGLVEVCFPKLIAAQQNLTAGCGKLIKLDLPSVTSIDGNAFQVCSRLKTVILRSESVAKLASTSAFSGCHHLNGTVNANTNPTGAKDGYIYVPGPLVASYRTATNWSTYESQFRGIIEGDEEALQGIINETLVNYKNDDIISIPPRAFFGYKPIESIDLQNVTKIGENAFYNCTSLTQANLPKVTEIGDWAFRYCSNLSSLNAPQLEKIYGRGLEYTKIASVNFPNLTFCGTVSFARTPLTEICLPKCTGNFDSSFLECRNLTKVDLPAAEIIGAACFGTCSALRTLILRNTSLCSLAGSNTTEWTNPFSGTPLINGQGYVYVPRALIEEYKADANWSSFELIQFRALEDYTIDGTITGELDETKI